MIRIVLFLSSLALATLAVPAESNQTGPATSPQTHDRLPSEKMAVLVAGPMRTAEEGGLPRGERAFDRLLEKARRRHGSVSVSVREADLLMSFGVQLFVRGSEIDREDMRKLSIPYLVRAIAATKRAFGPRHPETALALHTYGDLLIELQGDPPPEEAESALAEAHSIRLEALGPDDHETLAGMRALARVKAARFRVGGNLDEAVELFRRAIEISARSSPSEDYLKPASLRLALVRIYVKAGRADDALREARIVADEAAREQGRSEDDACFAGGEAMAIVADIEVDRPAEAEKLRQVLVPDWTCLDRIMEQLDKEAATLN